MHEFQRLSKIFSYFPPFKVLIDSQAVSYTHLNIDIHNGNPEFINISISGSGNVNANIMVQKAQLSISGSGSIMVEQVIEECVEQQTGTGNIVVKKRG